jgi:hypothetical protein
MEMQIAANEPKDPNKIVVDRPNFGSNDQPGFAGSKNHGPVQYLTPGKRGNYEPPETPPRHGPGKRSRKYHMIEEDNQ